VNGVRFLVTVNLEAALRELRIHRPRALWVDAICINQENLSERSSQVRLMSTIYKTATHTAVWLGEETDQSRCAFQLLHSLESLDHLKQWYMLPPSTLTSVIEENLIKFDNHLNNMPNAVAGLRDFWNDVMRRPWWTRAWIIQEIVLSSNATLICGRSSISWKSFQILFNFLGSSAVRVDLTNPWEDVRSGVSAMIHLAARYKDYPNLPLGTLIPSMGPKNATDPRDLVYSFLGLASECSHPLLDLNYAETVSTGDVFMNFAEYTIECEKTLDIICMSEIKAGKQLPTWCPDWSTFTRRGMATSASAPYPLLSKFFIDTFEDLGPEFLACGNRGVEARISRPSGLLLCRGICFDVVKDYGKPMEIERASPSIPLHDFQDWELIMLQNFGNTLIEKPRNHQLVDVADTIHGLFRRISPEITANFTVSRMGQKTWRRSKYLKSDKEYIAGGSVIEAYIRTLVTDRTAAHERLDNASYEAFWKNSVLSLECLSIDPTTRLRGQVVASNMLARICQRSLIVSEKGYIGLGPAKVQKGDLMCILYGSSVPIILRQEDDHFLFVGEAYVHGAMYGEVMHSLEIGKAAEREFIIR
jgi:hypothetical protein